MLHRFRDLEDSKGGFKLVKGIGASFRQSAKKSYDAGWVFQPEAAIDYQEKRRSPRYSFIASAELIEEQADVRIASRVSELSLHGCYLDMMNPFPTGTLVLVKISSGNALFQAKSKVVYSQPNMGAGVGFLELARGSQAVLDHWLEEAAKEQQRQA